MESYIGCGTYEYPLLICKLIQRPVEKGSIKAVDLHKRNW